MNKMRYFLVILAAIASGSASSLITVHFFTPYKAVAEVVSKKTSQKTERDNLNKMNVIEANEFRLIDLEGNCLAQLKVEEDDSMEALFDAERKKSPIYRAVLEMGTDPSMIRVTKNNVEIRDTLGQASLASGNLELGIRSKSRIYLHADSAGTAIQISDDTGTDRAVLGSVDLVVTRTGEVRKRPASSLVLFGKDGKVVHEVP